MRTLAISTVFFFGFGAVLLAQPGGGGQRGGSQGGGGQGQTAPVQPVQIRVQQSGDGQRQVTVTQAPMQVQQGAGPRSQGGGPSGQMQPGGGQQPPWAQGGAQGNQPARPGQPTAMQGNQPARPGQPAATQAAQPPRPGQPVPAAGQMQGGAMSANQVTQMISRLRQMDTNQNGVLEANEIPAAQRDRVIATITQLGGNPNATSFNLANLERQAMARAGGAPNQQQPNQQQQGGGPQQQRQQQLNTPLVPAFGERVTPAAAPVAFGQRAPVIQTAPQQGRGGGGQRGANQQVSSTIPRPTPVRISTPYDNIPANLRNNQNFSWFRDYDTDGDGQLSMAEYVAGRGGVWTEQIAGEFAGFGRALDHNGEEYFDIGLDRNGDGFATMDEALRTVQERTERLAAAQVAATPTQARPQPTQSQPGRQTPVTAATQSTPRTPSNTGNMAASQAVQASQNRQPGGGNNQGNAGQQGQPGRMQGGQGQQGGPQMGGRGNQGGGGFQGQGGGGGFQGGGGGGNQPGGGARGGAGGRGGGG